MVCLDCMHVKLCSMLSLSNCLLQNESIAKLNYITIAAINCTRHSLQSQKTQGFCVADFATLSDERRSRSKFFLLFNMDKRTFRSKI